MLFLFVKIFEKKKMQVVEKEIKKFENLKDLKIKSILNEKKLIKKNNIIQKNIILQFLTDIFLKNPITNEPIQEEYSIFEGIPKKNIPNVEDFYIQLN